MYMYIDIQTCTYVYTCKFMWTVYICISMYIHVHMCIHVYIYMNVYVYVCVYTCIHVYYVYIHIHVYICTLYTHTHTLTCIHLHTYIYTAIRSCRRAGALTKSNTRTHAHILTLTIPPTLHPYLNARLWPTYTGIPSGWPADILIGCSRYVSGLDRVCVCGTWVPAHIRTYQTWSQHSAAHFVFG